MRVLLLSRYGRRGASSRVRLFQYLPYLEGQGLAFAVAPLLGDDYLAALYGEAPRRPWRIAGAYLRRAARLLGAGRFDLVWLEKEALPWLPAEIELALGLGRVPYVADYDDAWFHRYDLHRSPVVRRLLGRKIDRVMAGAALVAAGNDYLAARARLAGARRVEIVPTVIDLARYPAAPAPESERFTIGWIGSPLTAGYLGPILPALREVAARCGARVVAVGAGPPAPEGLPWENRPWNEATEAVEILRFDVGIMPLPDEPWERGKCSYKLLQYMACGRPVVGSPVGMNREVIADGVNGYRAASPEQWIEALARLAAEPDLRRRLGAAGRKLVEERFSLHGTAPRLLALLRQAAG